MEVQITDLEAKLEAKKMEVRRLPSSFPLSSLASADPFRLRRERDSLSLYTSKPSCSKKPSPRREARGVRSRSKSGRVPGFEEGVGGDAVQNRLALWTICSSSPGSSGKDRPSTHYSLHEDFKLPGASIRRPLDASKR